MSLVEQQLYYVKLVLLDVFQMVHHVFQKQPATPIIQELLAIQEALIQAFVFSQQQQQSMQLQALEHVLQ
jgi:hypothetical protein